MKFQILVPDSATSERQYIIPLILNEFLGIDIELTPDKAQKHVSISFEGKTLSLPDTFFTVYNQHRLVNVSLPSLPLKKVDFCFNALPKHLKGKKIPIIYGEKMTGEPTNHSDNNLFIEIDIFGSAFFMLTRYEEAVLSDKDTHNRFPAHASVAYKENFINRPIINEYIDILWAAMNELWPNIKRKIRKFRQLISCDVDFPYHPSTTSILQLCIRLAGDFIGKRSMTSAIYHWSNYWLCKKGDYSQDPYFTFSWMMSECENAETHCVFNFITDTSNRKRDGYYNISEPIIRKLLREIYSRGHEIGLHTTYDSYTSAEKIQQEFNTLRSCCKNEGINQNEWGGRQHYLRWKTPLSFKNWDQAQLNYDSTLGYADQAGFRCGICYEYPVYDLTNRRALSLRERPLILMETSVFGDMYMSKNFDSNTLNYMKQLKSTCRAYNGDFTLLWHNSKLRTDQERTFYKALLSA